MSIAYLRNMEVTGAPFVLYEVVGMTIVGGVPPRPHPQPPETVVPPVDPDYGIPETGLPGWSRAAVGPPSPQMTPPADVPLAPNYAWQIVVYPDHTASWAQVGPHINPLKK